MKTPPDIEPYSPRSLEKISVHQYGLDGKYIQTFSSLHEAGKKTKTPASAISRCVQGKAKSANGYQWRKA